MAKGYWTVYTHTPFTHHKTKLVTAFTDEGQMIEWVKGHCGGPWYDDRYEIIQSVEGKAYLPKPKKVDINAILEEPG